METTKKLKSRQEYKTWSNVVEQLKEILKISRDEFNEREDIGELVFLLNEWAEAYHELELVCNE